MAKKLTQDEFIRRSVECHGDRYSYDGVLYQGSHVPVAVTCPVHGVFMSLPLNHLRGTGCTRCGKQQSGRTQRLTTDGWVEQARKVHGDRYSYALTQYVTAKQKVIITCTEHGDYSVIPYYHLKGYGCRRCGLAVQTKKRSLTQEEFFARATEVHGLGTYDYSEAGYVSGGLKVDIRCPEHGIFPQTPENHLYLGAGCPRCSIRVSKPQVEIETFLTSMGQEFISNSFHIIPPREIDIFLPSHKLAIEFNGAYWHSVDATSPPGRKTWHLSKYRECVEAGILLLQIDEHEWRDPVRRQVWESVIVSKLGLHERLAARRTRFSEITQGQAGAFLAEHHLQGDTPSKRWAFGLHFKDELVGVVTFSQHQRDQLNLTRLAFRKGLTVVGGAAKLFTNARRLLPSRDLVTFSNNRYSSGAIYPKIGFTEAGVLPPSYQWLYKNRLWDKRHMRHNKLADRIPDYDPSETEHENMFRAGARCLYDAGYQRWRLPRTSAM